jgi:hypothetical protein
MYGREKTRRSGENEGRVIAIRVATNLEKGAQFAREFWTPLV